ncbi:hypothetical protein D3C81_1631540 [compost metagenome]
MQAAQQRTADADPVTQLVGETAADMVAIFGGGEQGTEKQQETIGVLVIGIQSLTGQVLRITADLAHGTGALHAVTVFTLHLQVDHAGTHIIQAEVLVEQANERPDRARRIVVLGFAQQ